MPGQLSRTCLAPIISLLIANAALAESGWKFAFTPTLESEDHTYVANDTAYSEDRGYGFLQRQSLSTSKADLTKMFAVRLEEGNYDVKVQLGDPDTATATTIKTEARRLTLHRVETAPGEFQSHTFTVNVRHPEISTGGVTKLNGREKGPPMHPDWDELLTFEFNGEQPGVASIEITPAPKAITIFIAGDSTVTDQRNEPYAGWGQMLPVFFRDGVAVSNQAESGLSLHSFIYQKRLEKVLSMMKQGDYIFVQFGHNDQKDKRPEAGPFTTYKENLETFVEAARQKGGIPVLVTPMERLRMDQQGNQTPTLSKYAEAVRQVGTEQDVPVIDLNGLSLQFYAALGPERCRSAFTFYPAHTFPNQEKELKDRTHHNAYGAYELARCVVEGINNNVPELASHLHQDLSDFDPSMPDSPEDVSIPLSPMTESVKKPEGS